MDYEVPALDVIGCASELIQAYFGPQNDGGGWTFSQGLICSQLEEE